MNKKVPCVLENLTCGPLTDGTGIMEHALLLPIKALCYCAQDHLEERGDEIVVPRRILEAWMVLYAPGTPMLATLANPETGAERTLCINGSSAEEVLYAPTWILEELGYSVYEEGDQEIVYVMPRLEALEAATKLYLRLMSPAPPDADLRQAVETHLDRFHVLGAGTTLTITVEREEVLVRVEGIEPMPLSLLGGEVVVEFLEDVDTAADATAIATATATATAIATTAATATAAATPESPVPPPLEPVQSPPLTQEEIRQLRVKRFASLT